MGVVNYGIYVESSARFSKLVVENSTIEGFQRNGIFIFGDPTDSGISVQDVTLSGIELSDNGGAGGGGAADIQFWQYNGDASLADLALVGNSSGTAGVQSGIQFRGIGDGDGLNELPMGTVSLDNVDVSGHYRTQFIGIQRYSDVSSLTLSDVALGGAGSQITGTFGAALRFDAAGTGTPSSPNTIDLGNTHFRGLDDYAPAPAVFVFDVEFAPDNPFAFLRADATGTRWDTSGATDVSAADLSLPELFEVEDRILHYVEPDHPFHMGRFRGFAEVRPGNAYITDSFQSLISRGIEVASSGGTVHVAAGNYSEGSQVVIDHDVSLVGADRETTVITPNADTDSSGDARGWFLVESGVEFNVSGVTFDGLSGSGRKVFTALRHKGSGTIDDVAFRDVRFSKYIGLAIETTEETTDLDVTNSTFDNIQRLGILYKFAGTTGTFSGNTYIPQPDRT